MIEDVDESIRNLIRREVAQGSAVEVVFDAPTKEWAARRNAPTIDAYLYDLREDLRRRQVGEVDVVDMTAESQGRPRTVARRRPPRYFKLSYLLTAWTPRPEDEHRLLSSLLQCFVRHDHLPGDVLAGELEGSGVTLPLTLAIPPPEDRALSDVWSALGGELKPSLDLVLVVPVDLDREQATSPEPERIRVDLGTRGVAPPPVVVGDQTGAAVGRVRRLRRDTHD